ncbi:scy1-like protein 2 isoform x7 [Plakobranchus ocellatus]|uniref:Scy1-like protein 2 isoform x7 n=1 Tax=Plakobranchus ocellatus TaxID=259542 RepID=A0AAV4ACQ2_9GAST|nr:scy1-like protein 2 isoform x7 [Plakobranchus ocellatus]
MIHGRRKLVKANGRQPGYSGGGGAYRAGGGGGGRFGGGWGGKGGGEGLFSGGIKEYQRRKESRAGRDKSPILSSPRRDYSRYDDQRKASCVSEELSPATLGRKRLSIQAGTLTQSQGQGLGQGRRLTCFWDNNQRVLTGITVGKEEVETEKREEREDYEEEEEEEEGHSPPRGGCRPWVCAMDMFTLLKNSMGADDVNPILKHFTLGRQTGSAGVEMTWKIYEAVRNEDKKVSTCLENIKFLMIFFVCAEAI